jgi:hypothetical protein
MNYTLCFESDERAVTFGFKAETMTDFLEALPDFLKAVGFCLELSDGIFMLDETEQLMIDQYHNELLNELNK